MARHPQAELTGRRFGRFAVVGKLGMFPNGAHWVCICDCGNVVEKTTGNLNDRTFGCRECVYKLIPGRRTHGESGTKLYMIWANMRQKCSDPDHTDWKYYGGKGVRVCAEWQTYDTFRAWAKANSYQEGLTIDRGDPDGNYEPGNCEWVTQSVNSKRRWHPKVVHEART